MILPRRDQMVTPPDGDHPARVRLADLGGLTQLGVHRETLEPGGRSSERHWHARTDELLLVLEGEVTVVEDDGSEVLGPGDAAAWPAGVRCAHQVVNHSDAPATYLIVGTRMAHDTVHYAESGQVLRDADGRWSLEDADGTRIAAGTIDELRPLALVGDGSGR